jgi:hypothetical protein
MGTKKYSSYAQIDRELEILKIEKRNIIKSCLGFHRTKESLTPNHLLNNFWDPLKRSLAAL